MAKKSNDQKKPGTPSAGRVGMALAALVRGVIHCLPLLIILGAAGYGCYELWAAARAERDFRILPSMTVAEGSRYHPEAAEEFTRLSDLAAGKSLLDPRLLTDVRAQYEKSVWVKKVCRVERVFPNQVAVEFIPRRAFLQAHCRGYYWLLDDENILLPVAGTRAARPQLPAVEGDIASRPRYGEKWTDAGVVAAADALSAIAASPLASQLPVRTITVRRPAFLDRMRQPRHSRPRLEIKTHTDISILWGSGPDGFPGEITTPDKIVMLRQLLSRPGANRGKISLDVRTAVPGYKLRPGASADNA